MLKFLILTGFILSARAYLSYDDDYCVCPVSSTAVNSTPVDQRAQLTSVINSILALPLPFTPLGIKFKDILLNMYNSTDAFQQRTSEFVILYMSAQVPFLDTKPNGCSYAQLINASVTCLKYYNSTPMLAAIDKFGADLTSAFTLMASTSRKSTGCLHHTEAPPPTAVSSPSTTTCYKNGFAYNMCGLWMLFGRRLPQSLHIVVDKMYESDNYFDNYLALLATFALTPTIESIRQTWPTNLAYEIVGLQTAGPIPKCCCMRQLKRISILETAEKQETINKMQAEKNFYSSPTACTYK